MRTHKETSTSEAAATEAAEWFIDLQQDPSREQQEAFADWLRRSPMYVEEYLRLTALQGDLARLPEVRSLDVVNLIAGASVADPSENVLKLSGATPGAQKAAETPEPGNTLSAAEHPLGAKKNHPHPRSAVARGAPWRIPLAAACALLIMGLVSYAPLRDYLSTERYSTATGEQRSVTLADGSHVQLNTRSHLTAKVDEAIRDVYLKDGEALFQIARDPTRPFRVHTPQATIEAKGTEFNVYVKGDETLIALIEGKIDVLPSRPERPGARDEPPELITLSPGQEIAIASRATARAAPHPVDIESVTAWTERRLVFEDAPLPEVLAEFNRYSRQPLVIKDPALHDVRITASFDSQNIQTFVDSLAAAGHLRIKRQPDGSWLIER